MLNSGILVGASRHVEDLLPFWWYHYQRYNSLPVSFADFGMSSKARKFCEDRGEVIDVLKFQDALFSHGLSKDREAELNERFSSSIQSVRNQWFKKPFACFKSPFTYTLWVDIDCEIRGDISLLLSASDNPLGIGISLDHPATFRLKYDQKYSNIWDHQDLPLLQIYNSGVISFRKDSEVIHEWAMECLNSPYKYVGDQDALSYLIEKKGLPFNLLSSSIHFQRDLGVSSNALIYHWTGAEGKKHILSELELLDRMSLIAPLQSREDH